MKMAAPTEAEVVKAAENCSLTKMLSLTLFLTLTLTLSTILAKFRHLYGDWRNPPLVIIRSTSKSRPRSTSKSRPNNIRGGKCPSVRPSVHKKFLRFQ